MSRVVNNNRVFFQLLADCPAYQRQFLLKAATPQQLHAIVQVLYNMVVGHIPIPEENKRMLLWRKQSDQLTVEENHDCCSLHETLLQNELRMAVGSLL